MTKSEVDDDIVESEDFGFSPRLEQKTVALALADSEEGDPAINPPESGSGQPNTKPVLIVTRSGREFVLMGREEIPMADYRKKSHYVWRENLTQVEPGKPVFLEGKIAAPQGDRLDIALTYLDKPTTLVVSLKKDQLPPKMARTLKEGRTGWFYGIFTDEPSQAQTFEVERRGGWPNRGPGAPQGAPPGPGGFGGFGGGRGGRDWGRNREVPEDTLKFQNIRREFTLISVGEAGDARALKKIKTSLTGPEGNVDLDQPIAVSMTVSNTNADPMVDVLIRVHAHIGGNTPNKQNHLGTQLVAIPRVPAKQEVTESVNVNSKIRGSMPVQVITEIIHGVPTPE